MKYIVAHDLGTTGNKAVLYSAEGRIVSHTFSPYETHYPRAGYVEQEAEDWWRAVCVSTRELLSRETVAPAEVAAVAFSAQMMGCLIVDREGRALRRSIIWADTRSVREVETIADRIDRDRIYEITGHRLSASYSAAKLLWIREHERDLYKKTHKMVQAKDYIVQRLTGEFVTDFSDASGTNMFDLREKTWSKEILDAIGVPERMLPTPVASTTVVGGVRDRVAEEAGLAPGTPVVIGGGDGACATVGAGVVRSGRAYNVLGTSSWIAMAAEEPVIDPGQRTFTWVHLDPALYMPCGTMQSAGFSYTWFKDVLCTLESAEADRLGSNVYETLNEYVHRSAPGARGLLFLPYLLGERSPWWEPDARAAFVGLGASHTKEDMTRAVLEGVAHNLRIILGAFDETYSIERLVLIGGGARNDAWTRILADLWRRPLDIPEMVEDATSMGAAICGGVGVGLFDSFAVAEELVVPARTVEPNLDTADLYDRLHRAFLDAYRALEPIFRDLARYR
ncbi:MAG: xylulokinase [Spirochaetales bacterium]|nr:xylulokinase [Spirochaetales bacterium]